MNTTTYEGQTWLRKNWTPLKKRINKKTILYKALNYREMSLKATKVQKRKWFLIEFRITWKCKETFQLNERLRFLETTAKEDNPKWSSEKSAFKKPEKAKNRSDPKLSLEPLNNFSRDRKKAQEPGRANSNNDPVLSFKHRKRLWRPERI